MSNIVPLVLKCIWYDKKDRGEKTYEYRQNKPYWQKRILRRWGMNKDLIIKFFRAYTSTTMSFKVKNILVTKEIIAIELGERLN